jgi:hypothetical protein
VKRVLGATAAPMSNLKKTCPCSSEASCKGSEHGYANIVITFKRTLFHFLIVIPDINRLRVDNGVTNEIIEFIA